MTTKQHPTLRVVQVATILFATSILGACASTADEQAREIDTIHKAADAIRQVTNGTPIDPIVKLAENLGVLAVGLFGGAGATHVVHKQYAKKATQDAAVPVVPAKTV